MGISKKTSVCCEGITIRCNMESTSVFVREHTKIRCRFRCGTHPTRFYSYERWIVLTHVISRYVDSACEKYIVVNERFSFAVLLQSMRYGKTSEVLLVVSRGNSAV